MHQIYHTDAFILRSIAVGEANKKVWLYTEELGLVIAIVQGIRKPGSKLSYSLVDYSLARVDLVKGKNTWRLINLENKKNPLHGVLTTPLARSYVRSLGFVERLYLGEDQPSSDIFEHLLECANIVEKNDIDSLVFDTLSLWKIIALLGYIAPDEDTQHIVDQPLSVTIGEYKKENMKPFIKEVHDALQNSHL